MPASLSCELWNGRHWVSITIEQALELPSRRRKRCPECGGRVRAHKASDDGIMAAHFEHFERHPGCSLGDSFDSNRRPHPEALR